MIELDANTIDWVEHKKQVKYDIRCNAIEKEKNKKYPKDSIIPVLKKNLSDLGYEILCANDCIDVCLEHPLETNMIILECYKNAIIDWEKEWIMNAVMSKKNVDLISFFINEFINLKNSFMLRVSIGCFLEYCTHEKYIPEYIDLLINPEYDFTSKSLSDFRCYIVGAVSKFNDSRVKEVLKKLIYHSDEGLSFNSLKVLGRYKDESLRPIFEEFLNHDDKEYRKIAQKAIEKLDKQKEKK